MSNIEWTGETLNPTTGCDRISPGCDNCYALTMAKRLKAMGQAKYQNDGDPRTSGPGFGLTIHPDTLDVPLRWKKPRTVFVNSMSDLFHARVPVAFIMQVWQMMQATPQHTYQILTKRPERLVRVLDRVYDALELDGPLDNVWLGTSVESDEYVRRIDALAQVRAAVLFVSAEPLLGPLPSADFTGINWVIIGGESGPGARPFAPQWATDLIDKSRQAGAAPFVKQLGSVWARDTAYAGKTVAAIGDTKGGNPKYWPADLRVREYPAAVPEAPRG
jgi:protein gp37